MRLLLLWFAVLPQLLAGDPARDARWRQDLATVVTRLPAVHPNLFFQTPRAVFDQAAGELNAAIPDLNDAEVMTGLARIVALPGDGHTNLFLTQRNSIFRRLPLTMRWFEDGLFITAAGADYARAVGTRVLRIGGRSVEEAYQAVSPIVSHENDIWVREFSPNYLINADILQALKIAPDNLTVHFELEELGGARFTLEIASLDPGASTTGIAAPDSNGFVALWRQHNDLNYWFTYTGSSRTLYFGYNSCAEQSGRPFAQFNAELWAAFDSNPVDLFVIDLRNNSGGSTQVLGPFLVSAAARAERLQQARLAIIIGRRTYSSAINNAIELKQGPVTIYGEPSGGSPNSYGEVQQLVLPNSQLSVSYSTKYFSYPQYPSGSLLPDVPVKMYAADYFARHDPFLAAALAGGAPRPTVPQQSIAMVSAAHFRPDRPVAPGSFAALFGDFGAASAGTGLEVLVNGAPAAILAAAPGQINLRVPEGTATGMASIRVRAGGAEIASGVAAIDSVAPGLFVIDSSNLARPAAILGETGKGSVISLYGTGQGAAEPPPQTRVYFGSELAEVLFSGAQPSFPGLWQINVRVPDSAAVSGQVPVFVVLGSAASNAVTMKVPN